MLLAPGVSANLKNSLPFALIADTKQRSNEARTDNIKFAAMPADKYIPSFIYWAGPPLYWESLLNKHPFIDGNKRTGYVLTRLFLLTNNYDFTATQQDRYKFIVDIASGKMKFEEIRMWLAVNTGKQ